VKFTADDLQFQDDEEAEFGSDGDYGMSYSSGNDRLEINDKINSATSYIPRNRSGSLVKGRFGQTVAEGKVLADDGNVYDTIQAAENAASSWIRIGEGRFNESVTVDTAGMTVLGNGYKTIIDGKTSKSVILNASDIEIRNLSVRTDPISGGNAIDTNSGADSCSVIGVTVRNSGLIGVRFGNGTDHLASRCIVENAGNDGMVSPVDRVIYDSCVVKSTGDDGIQPNADDSIVSSCLVDTTKRAGIRISGGRSDNIIIGNRVQNAGTDGITISGTDNIIANNRVSDSGNSNIDDSGTNTTLDANLTGPSN
jgi:hypothetical protein